MRRARAWVATLACPALLFGCTTSKAGAPVEAGVDVATGCQDVGGPIAGTPVATFDTDIEQFVFDVSHYGNAGDAGLALTNLADPSSGTTPSPSLSHDSADGDPSPGSLQIVAPFSGPDQILVAYRFFGCAAIHDWTAKTLHVRIKVAEGDYTGEAWLYAATSTSCSSYDFGYGTAMALAHTSCWQELTFDVANPYTRTAGYDPASITTFGVQFVTYAAATPVTFLVDSFSVE